MTQPLISIIIPVYNTAPLLDRCLQSVCAQTYSHIEIIVVDDGSTDQSPALCDAYAQRDARVRVIHQPNGGASAARSAGLRAAKGEYILYVDSDDYMETSACESFAKVTEDSPDLVAGNYYYHDLDGSEHLAEKDFFADGEVVSPKDYIIRCMQKRYIECMAWMYMYRRAFLLENSLFYRKGWLYEDQDLMFRMLTSAKSITVIRAPIYHYVRREGSIVTQHSSWKSIHDSIGVLVHNKEIAEKTEDPELRKYIYHNIITSYLGVWEWKDLYGWNCLGMNVWSAVFHVKGKKTKVTILCRDLKYAFRTLRGRSFRVGREFAETVAADYQKKALCVYPAADAHVLHVTDRLQKQGYAVTLVTCPETPSDQKAQRSAGQYVREMREKGVRIEKAPLQKSGGSFLSGIRSAGILRRHLSNGYEIVLCGSEELRRMAYRSGKVYAEKGLTEMDVL